MDSFLTLGDTSDEMGYFSSILNMAQSKADNTGYAERRAQEMANGDLEDYSLEGKQMLACLCELVWKATGVFW